MSDSNNPKTRIPGFKLHSVLGRGAMSIVFRGTQTATGVDKAVKLLRPEHLGREDLRQRFAREATLSEEILHPNILNVEMYGEHNNVPYMILPLVDPETLGDKISSRGPLPVLEAVKTMIKILEALATLHQSNVIHRDIKAENILYTTQGDPVLSDLGLAYAQMDTRITSIGTGPLGTPQYMAPEQWMGDPLDRKTDIFACGVLFFHLLTASFPYPAETPDAVVAQLMKEQPEKLPQSLKPKELRQAVQQIVDKAIAIEPNDRFTSAQKMKEALEIICYEDAPQQMLHKLKDLVYMPKIMSHHGSASPSSHSFFSKFGSESTNPGFIPNRKLLEISDVYDTSIDPDPPTETLPKSRLPSQHEEQTPTQGPHVTTLKHVRDSVFSSHRKAKVTNNDKPNGPFDDFNLQELEEELESSSSSPSLEEETLTQNDSVLNALISTTGVEQTHVFSRPSPKPKIKKTDSKFQKADQGAADSMDATPTPVAIDRAQPAPTQKRNITTEKKQTSPFHGNQHMQQLNDEKNPQKLAINPVEIAPGSYWVGKRTPGDFFFANPYLRTFKGNNEEFNLIIDPGSSSDFSIVQAKCSRIIGNLSKINAAFINHQDPDVGSSVGPLIGRYSPGAYCLCTEDTWRLVHYYNIPRERFVPLEKYPNGFRLPTGHKLIPVPSPFCHFVGAMMIYDPETCVLYSGDLFGGLTDKNAKGLWADETDWVGMRAFHQIYMPTRGALSNAIKNIRNIKGELKIIAPQHGRLLTGDIMHAFMDRLENLSCGLDILSDRQATPDELLAWTTVLQRLIKRASDFTTEDLYKLILENNALEGLIQETDSGIEIRKMGKYTIEQILRSICEKLNDKDIEGMIKYEAVYATGELGLPTPNMDIDEGDAPHSKGSMLGSVVD